MRSQSDGLEKPSHRLWALQLLCRSPDSTPRPWTVPRAATRGLYLAISSCLHLALITCNTERAKAAAWPRLCQSANTGWTVHVPAWFQRLLLRGFDKFTKTNTVGAFKHQSWLFFLRGNRIQTPRPNKWKHGPQKKFPRLVLFCFFSFPPTTPSTPPLLRKTEWVQIRLHVMRLWKW